jgi:hypothetical protein
MGTLLQNYPSHTIVVAVIGLVLLAPTESAQAEENSRDPSAAKPSNIRPAIEGRVTDLEGKPVVDALVQWGYKHDPPEKLQQMTTDGNGRYRLEVRHWGTDYRLGVSAEGMAPQWVFPCKSQRGEFEAILNDEQNPPAKTADFKLEPQHRLRGIVVDHRGEPIPAVTVRAQTASSEREDVGSSFSFLSYVPAMPIPGTAPRATSTGPDGRFVLDHLPSGKVHLSVETPYRHANSQNYAVDREAKIFMFGSGRRGTVRIRVLDADGREPVTIYVAQFPRGKPQQVSTEDGRIELAGNFEEGRRYGIYVYSKHYAVATAAATAFPLGSNEETEVKLKPGEPMSGQLVEEDTGKPIPNGQLLHGVFVNERHQRMEWGTATQFSDNGQMLNEVQYATTDEHGSFWFSEWPKFRNGTQFILTPGYARMIVNPADRPMAGDDGRVQIKLAPEATVAGTLVNDGKPQAGVQIFVQRSEPRGKFEEKYEKIQTDAEGKFRIGSLTAGTYDISYWTYPTHSLYKAKAIATVKLARGEQRTLEPFTIGELGVRRDESTE